MRDRHQRNKRLSMASENDRLSAERHLAHEVRQLRTCLGNRQLPHAHYDTTVQNVQKGPPMAAHFRWFLASATSGALADGIATTAMPLLVVGLTTDPFLVALLQVAAGLPWILFSLHAGVLVDRVDRRTVLWSADAFRCAVAASVVALVAFGAVNVPLLLCLAFLEGLATVAFRAASPAMLPSLVLRSELGAANAHLQTAAVITGGFVGPAAGAALYPLARLVPFVGQCLAIAASVLCLRRLPPRPSAPSDRAESGTVRTDIHTGLRAIVADPIIRSLAVTAFLLAASTGMLQAVLVLHVTARLRAPTGAYGALFVVYALGCLVGSRLPTRLRRRLGGRTCLLLASGVGAGSLLLVAVTPDVYGAGVGMAALGIASMVYNVTAATLRQERIPDALLGRVSSAFNLVGVGAVPLAALAAGGIASMFGTTAALLVAAGTCVIGFAWVAVDMGETETSQHGPSALSETARLCLSRKAAPVDTRDDRGGDGTPTIENVETVTVGDAKVTQRRDSCSEAGC